MMNTGKKTTKHKFVDMSMVHQLFRCRREQNKYLAGTKLFCDLYPKLRPKKSNVRIRRITDPNELTGTEPCISCKYKLDCYHYRWEREYIHRQENANKTSKRRERQRDRKKEKRKILRSHLEYKEPVYPCESFNSSCPNREICSEGQECPWKE